MAKDAASKLHESAFIESFIVAARSERYTLKLSSAKHRRSFLDRLNHQLIKDLDDRFVSSATHLWPDDVEECYLIADDPEYDGRLVSSAVAKDAIKSSYFGIVVSFRPGKLACYKGEAPSKNLWLTHP
ncbi:hypothetical protein OAS39_10645 [Pirellulales bacterium]|nr:hypothetical protein [Pirellulales bacterium]